MVRRELAVDQLAENQLAQFLPPRRLDEPPLHGKFGAELGDVGAHRGLDAVPEEVFWSVAAALVILVGLLLAGLQVRVEHQICLLVVVLVAVHGRDNDDDVGEVRGEEVRGDRRVALLEHHHADVVPDVALLLDLLAVGRAVRQEGRDVEHDVVAFERGEHRVCPRHAAAQPAAVAAPVLQLDLLADDAAEVVERLAPLAVGEQVVLEGLSALAVDQPELERAHKLRLLIPHERPHKLLRARDLLELARLGERVAEPLEDRPLQRG